MQIRSAVKVGLPKDRHIASEKKWEAEKNQYGSQ